MKLPVLNFLIVELFILIYSIILILNNTYPDLMSIVFMIHFSRLNKHYKFINKELKPNLFIFFLCAILIFFTLKSCNYLMSGILFGLTQYYTYLNHEKQSKYKYKWVEYWIDIPITIFSFIVAYIGFKKNKLILVPFVGDVLYHLIEFCFHQ